MDEKNITLLEKWQEEALNVFRFFIELCKENNIKWFAAYGTALGAVRHHGFIPWDDDIDVFVPRPDYNRLLELFSNADLGEYELVTPWNREGYYLRFSKLCKKNSTILERKDYPVVLGIFVDIFPLDACTNNKEELKSIVAQNNKLNYQLFDSCSSNRVSIRPLISHLLHGHFKEAIDLWNCYRNPKSFRTEVLKRMTKIIERNPYDSSEFVTTYSYFSSSKIYRKDWFEKIIKGTFEGIEINLPANIHEILRISYGNYMQLPPVEKRITHHLHYFLSFDKRYEASEILKE